MRLLIQVFLPSNMDIRKDLPALGAWDRYGISEELDYSLPQFPRENFINVTGNTGAAKSVNGLYSWRVSVPTADQVAQLNLTTLPSVLFFDIDQNKYVARLDGTPQGRGVIADLLRGVFSPGTTGPGISVQTAGLWVLALLLFTKIKKAA